MQVLSMGVSSEVTQRTRLEKYSYEYSKGHSLPRSSYILRPYLESFGNSETSRIPVGIVRQLCRLAYWAGSAKAFRQWMSPTSLDKSNRI